MQQFCPLASGSKGNSLFLATKTTQILVDAGLSLKSLNGRLESIGKTIKEIEAILITHEHSDHIKGIGSIAAKYQIPIFANRDTAKAIQEEFSVPIKFKIFSTGEPFSFGDLEITPFPIQHDTLDPVAFSIKTAEHKIGICTDLGLVTSTVKHHLTSSDFLYLEANHEPSMVHASHRPNVYKERVLGRQGHLSNQECADLLLEIAHPNLKHVYLAHLSEECNHPEVAMLAVKNALLKLGLHEIPISIARQECVSHNLLLQACT